MTHPCRTHEKSAAFWEDFPKLEWDELIEKYEIPREKEADRMSAEDRQYFARSYKARHRRHLIHCAKESLLKKLKK